MRQEHLIFDIWDTRDKKLHQAITKTALASYAELIARDDCYLIHHVGQQTNTGKEIRHGDVLRNLKTGKVFVVVWDAESSQYALRGHDTFGGALFLNQYEYLDNKFMS